MDNVGMTVELLMEAWASNPAMTPTELRDCVESAGNVVLEVHDNGNLLKIGYTRQPVLHTERP